MRDALRPELLEDFAGQPAARRQLEIVLGGSKARGELADHVLLSGPPGVGKTTLAGIIANELGVDLVTTSGPAIERPADVVSLLSAVREPTVVFIDEIHRLPITAEEVLYPAMEDGVLDIVVGDGVKARSLRLPLEPICVVGATTQAGLLTAPLRGRFGFQVRLGLYSLDDLSSVVARSAGLLGMSVDVDAATLVASRSRGTPRIANSLLRRVRDFAAVNDTDHVDVDVAGRALAEFGIDSAGLDELSVDILRTLCTTFAGGPVGAKTLSSAAGEAESTLVDVVEPFLIRCGFIARTPQGRVATADAFTHLGIDIPATSWAAHASLPSAAGDS